MKTYIPRGKPCRQLSLKDELAATQRAIEKAKLAKLETQTPKAPITYARYEDLPPPHPDEREMMYQKLVEITDKADRTNAREKRNWYLSMVEFAP